MSVVPSTGQDGSRARGYKGRVERVRGSWWWLRAYLRGAPATLVYTFTVVVTWYSASTASRALERQLLRAESSNLTNMIHDPLRVLVSSAFWIDSPVFPVLTTGGLLAVMVPAERALGTRRWLAVFVAGHVVATVLTVFGIAQAIRSGLLPARVSDVTDVGVSYGAAAVSGTALHLLPRRWMRWTALAVLLGGLGAFAVVDHTFTDVGHLVALGVGLALWPVVRRWMDRSGRPARDVRRGAGAQVGVEEPQDAAPGVLGRRKVLAEAREAHE